MYGDRLRTLARAYSSAARNNKAYQEIANSIAPLQAQIGFLEGLSAQLHALGNVITEKESEWREGIFSVLETEIMESLSTVYPQDGYKVKLSTRVLRGKIHIEARVFSIFAQGIPGPIGSTQGRLFQQIVSFSALFGVMNLLGIRTVYFDEAFSGSSKRNIKKLNALLRRLKNEGYNVVMIAQDTSLADGIEANRLILSRSIDNKTLIKQEVVG